MRDPYEVLGLSRGVPDEEVKRAFRRLAKQLHPDLHPDDPSVDPRFREVISAYHALSHPQAHARHDAAGPAPKRRGSQAKATAIVVFLFTVGSVSVGALWQDLSDGEMPPREGAARPPPVEGAVPPIPEPATRSETMSATGGPLPAQTAAPSDRSSSRAEPASHASTQQASDLSSARSSIPDERGSSEPSFASGERSAGPPANAAARGQAASARTAPATPLVSPGAVRDLTWAAWRNARFGFSLAYPADIFAPDPAQATDGAAFRSRDGRARFLVSASINRNGATPAAHRRSLMEGPYKGAAFDYAPRRAYWFVLSGVLGEEIFYERVTVSCDRRMVHGWKLVYPLAERALYDRVVEEVHRRYSHSNGPGARCGEIGDQASRAFRPDSREAGAP